MEKVGEPVEGKPITATEKKDVEKAPVAIKKVRN